MIARSQHGSSVGYCGRLQALENPAHNTGVTMIIHTESAVELHSEEKSVIT